MSRILKSDLSVRLKAFSLVCAGLVVFVHCVPGETLGAPQFSIGWWIYRLWTETVCRMAVPALFFMSGYWLAKHADEKGWWTGVLRKRFRSLLVPYVIWNVGYWALVTFQLWLGMRFFGKSGLEDFTWRTIFDVLGGTVATPFSTPHWFIKQLMLFVLIVLPFAWMIKRSKVLAIIVVFGTLFVGSLRPSWCFIYVENMFYFLGGFAVMIWGRIPQPRGQFIGFVYFAFALALQAGHEAGFLLSSKDVVWGFVRSIFILPLIAYAVYSLSGVMTTRGGVPYLSYPWRCSSRRENNYSEYFAIKFCGALQSLCDIYCHVVLGHSCEYRSYVAGSQIDTASCRCHLWGEVECLFYL